MGTYATVSVPADEKSMLTVCADDAKSVFSELEKTLTVYDPGSEISRLNAAAGRSPVAVSGHTRRMLRLSRQYGELSGGAFDVTVSPLIQLWGFSGGQAPVRRHAPEIVAEVLTRTGYHHLAIEGETAFLDTAGMSVDLGGIAKGYAVDVCFERLTRKKIPNVMVNLGGNLRCNGVARAGRPWNIGVQNPFEDGEIVGTIGLTGGRAVATSGNYERFVVIDGKRYAHIIDPRSGFPVEGMAGVTVISGKAVEADALSTALYVAGISGAAEILARTPASHALLIPDEQPIRIFLSPGFRQHFSPTPKYAVCVAELPSSEADAEASD
jgi:FAD:protein FMN transferase